MRWEACMHSSSSPVLHNHDVITWQRAQRTGKVLASDRVILRSVWISRSAS